jgi:hypothetical protein
VSACSFPQLPYGSCKFGTGSADCRPGLTCQPDGTCAKPCEPPASVACIHPLSASFADSGVFVCLADGGWNSSCEFPCVGNQRERCELDGDGGPFEGEAVCTAGFFAPCAATPATQCSRTQGVCAGKWRRFGDSQPCTRLSYGSDYSETEVCGDGIDNDCDGNIDIQGPVSLASNVDEVVTSSGGNDSIYPYRVAVSRPGPGAGVSGELLKVTGTGARSAGEPWASTTAPGWLNLAAQPGGVIFTYRSSTFGATHRIIESLGMSYQRASSFVDGGRVTSGPKVLSIGGNLLAVYELEIPDGAIVDRVEPISLSFTERQTTCSTFDLRNATASDAGTGLCLPFVRQTTGWSNRGNFALLAHSHGRLVVSPFDAGCPDGGLRYGDYCGGAFTFAPETSTEIRATGTNDLQLAMWLSVSTLEIRRSQGFSVIDDQTSLNWDLDTFPVKGPFRGTAIAASPVSRGTKILVSYIGNQSLYLKSLRADGGSGPDQEVFGTQLIVDAGTSLAWSPGAPDRALLVTIERLPDAGSYAAGRFVCMPASAVPY